LGDRKEKECGGEIDKKYRYVFLSHAREPTCESVLLIRIRVTQGGGAEGPNQKKFKGGGR